MVEGSRVQGLGVEYKGSSLEGLGAQESQLLPF